jgi:hypothetical protein
LRSTNLGGLKTESRLGLFVFVFGGPCCVCFLRKRAAYRDASGTSMSSSQRCSEDTVARGTFRNRLSHAWARQR